MRLESRNRRKSQIRNGLGCTQLELAHFLGMRSISAVNMAERNERSFPLNTFKHSSQLELQLMKDVPPENFSTEHYKIEQEALDKAFAKRLSRLTVELIFLKWNLDKKDKMHNDCHRVLQNLSKIEVDPLDPSLELKLSILENLKHKQFIRLRQCSLQKLTELRNRKVILELEIELITKQRGQQ